MPALTNFPYDPILDLAPWVGQRQYSYRFNLINGVSGENLGTITPIRPATLSHDTTRAIKRQLRLAFGRADTAAINPITDQVTVKMTFPSGVEYPMGRYLFSDETSRLFTSGRLGNATLNDRMYIIDQPIEEGFATNTAVTVAVENLIRDFPITYTIEPSPYDTTESWGFGARRGSIIESLALTGDYLSPWFDNTDVMRFIRNFNPAFAIPDFDWDEGDQVMRDSITESSNILNAPNRFIVASTASADRSVATYGIADVPVNAPNSFEKRGFRITEVTNLQVGSIAQCTAIAQNIMQRRLLFQTTNLSTAADPRHDSYNVIKWQNDLWLEVAWSLTLTAGEPMSHTLRRGYR